jgi:hypothetical protein
MFNILCLYLWLTMTFNLWLVMPGSISVTLCISMRRHWRVDEKCAKNNKKVYCLHGGTVEDVPCFSVPASCGVPVLNCIMRLAAYPEGHRLHRTWYLQWNQAQENHGDIERLLCRNLSDITQLSHQYGALLIRRFPEGFFKCLLSVLSSPFSGPCGCFVLLRHLSGEVSWQFT